MQFQMAERIREGCDYEPIRWAGRNAVAESRAASPRFGGEGAVRRSLLRCSSRYAAEGRLRTGSRVDDEVEG